jgi:hypothetical protein
VNSIGPLTARITSRISLLGSAWIAYGKPLAWAGGEYFKHALTSRRAQRRAIQAVPAPRHDSLTRRNTH